MSMKLKLEIFMHGAWSLIKNIFIKKCTPVQIIKNENKD